MECVRQAAAGDQAFNLAAPEVLDYGRFMETLRAVSDRPFTTQSLTVEESFREGIPLPFPLTEEESELFSGEMITRLLGLRYTPFREGMEKTFIAFRDAAAQRGRLNRMDFTGKGPRDGSRGPFLYADNASERGKSISDLRAPGAAPARRP